MGLALCLQKDGPGARAKEAMGYLLEAMEALLQQNVAASLDPEPTECVFVHVELSLDLFE